MQRKESLKLSQTVIKASYVGAFRPKGLAARRETPLRGLSVLASSASIGQLIGMTIKNIFNVAYHPPRITSVSNLTWYGYSHDALLKLPNTNEYSKPVELDLGNRQNVDERLITL